jgi:predicted nicotinamide N-methyase
MPDDLDPPPLDAVEFVRTHTTIAPVPFVEELRLHQASDPFLLWETTERDLAARGIALPYWAFPWAGGTALAAYLLDHPHEVQGRRVLDLATGSGLVAIAAARAGAAEVLANDIDPIALAAVELNAALNGVTIRTHTADLLDAPDHPALATIEVALAGDVAYERPMARRLFGFLAALAARGVTVLIGDPDRAYLPTGLDRLATYDIPVPRTLEAADVKPTTIWRLRA